jgi:hypothetical protein
MSPRARLKPTSASRPTPHKASTKSSSGGLSTTPYTAISSVRVSCANYSRTERLHVEFFYTEGRRFSVRQKLCLAFVHEGRKRTRKQILKDVKKLYEKEFEQCFDKEETNELEGVLDAVE